MTGRTGVKLQLGILSLVLIGLGLASLIHKLTVLQVPLLPGTRDMVWQVEAKLSFAAAGDAPVKVSFAIPDEDNGYRMRQESFAGVGYGQHITKRNEIRRAEWTKREATGQQTLFYRAELFDLDQGPQRQASDEQPSIALPTWSESQATAVKAIIDHARGRSANNTSFIREIIKAGRSDSFASELSMLANNKKLSRAQAIDIISQVLATAEIPARRAVLVNIEQGRGKGLIPALEVFTGSRWTVFDWENSTEGLPPDTVLWSRGGDSIIDLEGGSDARIQVAVVKRVIPARSLVTERSAQDSATGYGFSLYSLPVDAQAAFSYLLLIPLAALIVVIARNIVGLKTSGTFMPVLIALAFRETGLLAGWLVFAAIIFTGVLLRGWLTRLDLLLVPRIAAVVVLVVFLMLGFSIVSHQLGLESGLKVTIFPMIIIAWTIERLSIAAEEQGSQEALVQTGGSLLVATVCYLAMSIPTVEYLVVAYPETNLFLLVLILWIGIYTGYRLTELRRFEPLVQNTLPATTAAPASEQADEAKS